MMELFFVLRRPDSWERDGSFPGARVSVNLKQLEEETELGDNESFNDLYKKNHEIRSV